MPPPRIRLLPRLQRLKPFQRLHTLRCSFRPPRFAHPVKQSGFFDQSPRKIAFRCLQGFLVFHLLTTYGFSINSTSGISMLPTLPLNQSKKLFSTCFVLTSKLNARGKNVAVGDLIVYDIPTKRGQFGCKRIIGMPGDLVCVVSQGRDDDTAFSKGEFATYSDEMIRVPEGHCWLTGDNLEWSTDSRVWGPLPLAMIKGKIVASIWPVSAWKWCWSGGLADAQEVEPEWVVAKLQ